MVRFLIDKYRKALVWTIVATASVQALAIVVYDLDLQGLRSSGFDNLMTVYGICLFAIVPCVVAYHAAIHRYSPSDARPLRGWFLGLSWNSVLGAVSVTFGLVQAGLRHFLLKESESLTGDYLLYLLLGFILVLWVGGVVGWLGNWAAALLHRSAAE